MPLPIVVNIEELSVIFITETMAISGAIEVVLNSKPFFIQIAYGQIGKPYVHEAANFDMDSFR